VKEQAEDYNYFVSEVTDLVKEKMGSDYTVRIYKVIKNNSLELDSLVMLKDGKNFAPNIYLMPYYNAYLEGSSVQEIADRLCEIYKQSTIPMLRENFTYSFDDMKPFVIYRLVSYERNKKLLGTTPHIKYLDLALTFHCLVRNDNDGIGTIRITNEHMKLWNTSLTEISALAKENTSKLFPHSIRSMDEVLRGMLQEEYLEGVGADLADPIIDEFLHNSWNVKQQNMYVLTNQKGINGATCMLYDNVLRDFADNIHSDLFILPSSIHEIILVPCQKDMKKEAFMEMVSEVNRTQVAGDEILSDRVYFYTRKENAIVM
jgi:hypothetical protein